MYTCTTRLGIVGQTLRRKRRPGIECFKRYSIFDTCAHNANIRSSLISRQARRAGCIGVTIVHRVRLRFVQAWCRRFQRWTCG